MSAADDVPPLVASLLEYNAVKGEHIDDDMRIPQDREFGADQLAVIGRLVAAGGVPAEDAAGVAVTMTDGFQRSLTRAGRFRGTNQRHLRAALFAVWLDGLGLGLHHATTRPPTRQETP